MNFPTTDTGTTDTVNLPDEFKIQGYGLDPYGSPYKCKNCGDEGRISTTAPDPQCPNCGRRMEPVTN